MRGSRRAALTALLGIALACLAAGAPPTASGEGGQCRTRPPPTPEQRRARHARDCSRLVHEYMKAHTADFEAAHNVSKLVFFLHVPRTGAAGVWDGRGVVPARCWQTMLLFVDCVCRCRPLRSHVPASCPSPATHPPALHPPAAGKTYANCFLRTALPPSKRCAKSYDVLRYNVSAPGCSAIISHDDFSAAAELLPPDAATITQLRRCVATRWRSCGDVVGIWWLTAVQLMPLTAYRPYR